jgi:carbon storage regulator
MLVISRKQNESIIIGDTEVKITVIENRDGRVKLGIEAPKEIRIVRAEIAEMGDYNTNAAARISPSILNDLKTGK